MKVIFDTNGPETLDSSSLISAHGMALLNFLQALGFNASQLPLADLLRQYYQLKGHWLIVSPIHWQATHNDALISAYGKELGLSSEELQQCYQVLLKFLALENMTLHYHDETIWLLSDPAAHSLQSKSIDQMLGRSLMPELSQLDKSLFWQKLLTECQMLFASTLNQLAVNGVWPWGVGVLGGKKDLKVCADEHFFPFARLCVKEVTLYTPELRLKDQDIVLLQTPNQLHETHQQILNQMPTEWYWNDKAYLKAPARWWRRLWRKN